MACGGRCSLPMASSSPVLLTLWVRPSGCPPVSDVHLCQLQAALCLQMTGALLALKNHALEGGHPQDVNFKTLSCSHAACLQESVAPLFFATSSALLGGAARPFDTRDVPRVCPCSTQELCTSLLCI